MSTATFSTRTATSGSLSIVSRFVWKELRRTSGFAIGVAVLTLAAMLLLQALVPPADAQHVPEILLLVAFGGGAFVAIGAAITAFAVEREEQTDTFLFALPRYWWPTFLGKLIATFALAFGFAAVMAVVAWAVAGGQWPPAATAWQAIQLGSVLVGEAVAWGFLLSLLVPRPLLAAVLACAATSFNSQVAIALSVSAASGYGQSDFIEAIPARLALSGLVLLSSTLLARRWMTGTVERSRGKRRRANHSLPANARPNAPSLANAQQSLQPLSAPSNRAMLIRLFWQTWRESWGAMLAVVAVGLMLMASVELLLRTAGESMNVQLPLTLFFIPGLCGALAFRCDQRRNQYRFLAEHVGRPRLVWTVRVGAWAAFLALLLVPLGLLAMAVANQWLWSDVDAVHFGQWNLPTIAALRITMSDFIYFGIVNFALAAFTAFAFGQLASLLLKSEILAAGVGVFASVATLLFSYLIIAWRLPPVWCLLPIVVGCLAASYVRLPDRLVDRHTLRRWAGVVVAAVLPIALVMWTIPMIRQHQMESARSAVAAPLANDVGGHVSNPSTLLDNFLATQVGKYREQMRVADEVTIRYQAVLHSISDDLPPPDADGNSELGTDQDVQSISTSIASLVPTVERFPDEIAQLVELTKEPAARADHRLTWPRNVAALLVADFEASVNRGELDRALERYLALQRLKTQVLHDHMNWPTTLLHAVDLGTSVGAELLVDWATAQGQSSERLVPAVAQLQEVSQRYPPLHQFVVANYSHACEVLAGRDSLRGDNHHGFSDWAVLLDQLPGEHQRAEEALKLFAAMSLDYVGQVRLLDGKPLRDQLQLAHLPRLSTAAHHGPAILSASISDEFQRQRQWQAAASSKMAQEIWNAHANVNEQLRDRLLLRAALQLERVRLALIAYHWDHGAYPATLQSLAPEYITPLPADPFSAAPFQYAPQGFRYPLDPSNDHTFGPSRERKIAAGVPVVWSVGPNHMVPQESTVDVRRQAGEASAIFDDEEPILRTITRFRGTEGWGVTVLALPLPTAEAFEGR